jgi:hypothetical protein
MMKSPRFSRLVLAGLVVVLGAGQVAAGSAEIMAPTGFSFAGGHLDEQGSGYLLWKDVDGVRTVLERLENLQRVQLWHLDGYLAKGLRVGGDRILLQGQDAEGGSPRLVEARESELRLVWDGGDLARATGLATTDLSVSQDLQWWYAATFSQTTVTVQAGRLGESEARLRWVIDALAPDAFLAGLADSPSEAESPSEDGLRLALVVGGEGWLLVPGSNRALPLVRPEACDEIYTVAGSTEGFWATCGGGLRVLYPDDPVNDPADRSPQGIAPLGAIQAANLRTLPDGRTVAFERERGRPGTLRLLSWEDGAIRVSTPVPYPVPLGQVGHQAGAKILLRVGARGAEGERYRILPVELP